MTIGRPKMTTSASPVLDAEPPFSIRALRAGDWNRRSHASHANIAKVHHPPATRRSIATTTIASSTYRHYTGGTAQVKCLPPQEPLCATAWSTTQRCTG